MKNTESIVEFIENEINCLEGCGKKKSKLNYDGIDEEKAHLLFCRILDVVKDQ